MESVDEYSGIIYNKEVMDYKQEEMSLKWKIEKKYIRLAVTVLIVVVLSILFQYLLEHRNTDSAFMKTVNDTFFPILGGCIFAYLLNPVLYFFEHYMFTPLAGILWKGEDREKTRMKFSRALGIVCTLVFFFVVLIGGLYLVIPQVYQSLEKIVMDAPGYYDSFLKWMNSLDSDNSEVSRYLLMGMDRIYDQAMAYLDENILPNMDKIVVSITSGIVVGLKMVLNFFLIVIISVYVMAEKELLISCFKKLVYSLFPVANANRILKGVRYAHGVFGGFINGKIIDSFIIGVICYIVMAVAGLDYAVLISIIVGVTNVIPYFGPFIGAIPSALILLIVDWKQGLFFIIFVIILQQADGNIIGPLILGDRLKLSSMWILFAILVGGGFFGVPGMILGAPCFACVYALTDAFCENRLQDKNLPIRAKNYLQVDCISENGEIQVLKEKIKEKDNIENKDVADTKEKQKVDEK